MLQALNTHLQRCWSLTRSLRLSQLPRAAVCLLDAHITYLVEKPVLLGQLCKLNLILSLEHNLPKTQSSAESKSPSELQDISGTVENTTAPAGRGERALSSPKAKPVQDNCFRRQAAHQHRSLLDIMYNAWYS